MRAPLRLGGRLSAWLLLLALGPILSAAPSPGPGSVGDWLAGPGAAYASIEAELGSSAGILESAGLPLVLLLERLEEGAAKRVPPAELARAADRDTRAFASAAAAFGRSGYRLESDPTPLREAARALRSGLEPAWLDTIPAYFKAKGKPALDAARALTLAAALARPPLEGDMAESILDLASALAGSRLGSERYASLLSVYKRFQAGGGPRVLGLMGAALRQGRGLQDIERELERRFK
jgi:hypothetical protein